MCIYKFVVAVNWKSDFIVAGVLAKIYKSYYDQAIKNLGSTQEGSKKRQRTKALQSKVVREDPW